MNQHNSPPSPKKSAHDYRNLEIRITSPDQIPSALQKLKAYEHDLRGKAIRLKEFEAQLNAKEQQLKIYRKQILIAIREELMQHPKYEEQVKILEKFKDILEFVVKDIRDDIDDIMG
jgi:hypothetical protein